MLLHKTLTFTDFDFSGLLVLTFTECSFSWSRCGRGRWLDNSNTTKSKVVAAHQECHHSHQKNAKPPGTFHSCFYEELKSSISNTKYSNSKSISNRQKENKFNNRTELNCYYMLITLFCTLKSNSVTCFGFFFQCTNCHNHLSRCFCVNWILDSL